MSLFHELKRRNVIRVATAYVVAAWLTIQVVETLFPVFGLSANAIRVVVIILGIGFLPAVIVAWVFQFTPDGLKLDKDAGSSETSIPGRKLDRAIIVTLLLGISFFAFDKFVLAPERAAVREAAVAEQAASDAIVGFYGERSIAVIPFDNMSSDPEQEYFVDGVAEEVLNLLTRIRELRVISRSSAFAFKGQNLEIPEIAERLNVAHILEGSVRKAGNTIRVTAQLIEARTDTHLWSKTYERDLDDVFAIQDEIAADVVRNLQLKLLIPLPQSRRVDPLVLALTQQAKQLSELRPDGVGRKMESLLLQALAIDPDYVPALEWMVSALFFMAADDSITETEKLERRVETLEKILSIAPDNAFVDGSRAFEAWVAGDLETAAALFERSLSKNAADSNIVRIAGSFAGDIGRFDTAIRLLEHSVAIDPLCFRCLYLLSRIQFKSGDYARALKTRERFILLGNGGEYHYGQMLLLTGEPELALSAYQSSALHANSLQGMAGRAMAYFSLGQHEMADAEFAKLLLVEAPEDVSPIAEVAAWIGQVDLAFEWLEILRDRSADAAIETLELPAYKGLHDDPRWDAWRKSLGMSAARLDAIEFNPRLPE
jgi:adenylate cyclase